MTYREMAIKTVQIACQDLMENVEELIPQNTDGTYGINLVLHIPTLTDNINSIPTIKVVADSYVSRRAAEKIIDLTKEV